VQAVASAPEVLAQQVALAEMGAVELSNGS
jgi:hypothetical protein